jgi:putative endonuclease
MDKQYYVYVMTNKLDRVLYTGVTNDLEKRVHEHKSKLKKGFTEKYNVNKLIYYEIFDEINDAMEREKQIKKGSRQKKIDLISKMNPSWNDLSIKL